MKACLRRAMSLLGWGVLIFFTVLARAENAAPAAVYSLDFRGHAAGSALPWLREHGYDFKLDGEDLNLQFEPRGLSFSTDAPKAGLFGVTFEPGKEIQGAKIVRIYWGVDKFPEGANWEKGNNRLAVGITISFGQERISSGLPFGIYALPRFICPFIGEKEVEGKIYTGKFWKEGGRYLCVRQKKLGELQMTEVKLDELFRTTFHKNDVPPISAVGIQMNSKNTEGKAAAFIQRIEFLGGNHSS